MPIPVIVLCAVLFLLLALLAIRFRVIVSVRGEALAVELRVLFLRFRLYPRRKRLKPRSPRQQRRFLKKQAKKQAKKEAKRQRKRQKKALAKKENKAPRTLRQKIRFVRGVLAALRRRTRKHLRLHAARLHIRVATGDAATTAVAFGAVSQSVSYLLALLNKITKLRAVTPDVAIEPDFTAQRPDIDMHLILSIRLFGALAIAFGVVFSLLRSKLESTLTPNKKKPKQNASAKKGT